MADQANQQREQSASQTAFAPRELGKRAAGKGRHVYVSSALALTEPGPAAYGIVVTDDQGRVLGQRAHYIGSSTRTEATAQALLEAMRLAEASSLKAPIFRIDDAILGDTLARNQTMTGKAGEAMRAMRAIMGNLPGHQIQVVPTNQNLARAVALTPLVEWLPERTRRAEDLQVRELGDGKFEVQSESQPGQVYHVTFRLPEDGKVADGDPIQCECADFLYRGMPCKHLLAVARHLGATQHLFYREPAPS